MKNFLKASALAVKLVVLSVFAIAIAGCSLIGDPIADKVADAIDEYCGESYDARHMYRDSVNAQLTDEGHSVLVTCKGDPPPDDHLTVN